MGLKYGPKAIGEDLKNLSYFMPWAQDGTDKSYEMAQKTLPTADTLAQ